MIRRIVSATALTLALAAPLVSNASVFGRSNDGTATTAAPKGKLVKLTLKNNTGAAMTLYVNDQTITLAANSEQQIKTVVGTDVLDADHTTVRVHVTSELAGNTVAFR